MLRLLGWVKGLIDTVALRRWLLQTPVTRRAFIAWSVRRLNGAIPSKKAGSIRMFAFMTKDGRYDWMRLANNDPNCAIYDLPTGLFIVFFRHYMPDYLAMPERERVKGIDLYFDERFDEQRARYQQACDMVVEALVAMYAIDLFLLPKIHDDWYVQVLLACKHQHVPVMVTDREPVSSQKRMQTLPATLKRNIDFDVDRLCVASEKHRRLFVDAGFDPDTIAITGELKNDFWFRPDLWPTLAQIHPTMNSDRLKILFFAFGPRTYLYFFPGEERTWQPIVNGVHEVWTEFLARHPRQVQIIYKTGRRAARDYAGDVYLRLAEQAAQLGHHSMLHLNSHYKALELLVNVDCVVGFQTTAMIEALFTDKPIFYTAWGELYEEVKQFLLPLEESKAVIRAASREAFADLLDAFVADPKSFAPDDGVMQARKRLREQYYNLVDGQAGARALAEAKRLVERRREQASPGDGKAGGR